MLRAAPGLWGGAFQSTPAERKLGMLKSEHVLR